MNDTIEKLTPEKIRQLELLKTDLEEMQSAMANLAGKSPYEVEGRIRALIDKENEIKGFLRELGLLPAES